jgi:hypothetical protein
MARREAPVEALYSELLAAGESLPRLREFLARHDPEEFTLLALLRRPVPVRFLECVGTTPPWSERPRLLGAVVLNRRAPRSLSLRLLPALYWRDLADVAASPPLPAAVRARAEVLLKEQLPDMRLGEKVALGRIATPAVLPPLLAESSPRILEAALANPRLREEDLLVALRAGMAPAPLLEAAAASPRWQESYAVRLALVLQPRTPLGVALAQISSLAPRDLRRVAEARELKPLIQAAARRLAEKAPGRV